MLYAIKYYTIDSKLEKVPDPNLILNHGRLSILSLEALHSEFILMIFFSEKLEMFNETQIGCTADCHVGCPEGTYRLPGMVECKPRLNCDQIRNLTKGRNLIGGGGVKRVNIQKKLHQFLDKDQVKKMF